MARTLRLWGAFGTPASLHSAVMAWPMELRPVETFAAYQGTLSLLPSWRSKLLITLMAF